MHCRKLYKIKRKADGAIFFADSYAIWEDLGNGMLQPTISRQTQPSFEGLKIGQGYNGYLLQDSGPFYVNTSMNNCTIR